MYKTTNTKITPVYKPKPGMQIEMESGTLGPIPKVVKTKKKPKGVTDKAWAILNVEGAPDVDGDNDMPQLGKNKA